MLSKARAQELGITLDKSTRYINGEMYSALPSLLCEAGRLGRMTGKYGSIC